MLLFTWATSRAKKELRRGKDWLSSSRFANIQSEKDQKVKKIFLKEGRIGMTLIVVMIIKIVHVMMMQVYKNQYQY